MNRTVLFIGISLIGFLFTCTIYNFKIILSLLFQLYDRLTLIYITSTLFFLLLFRFMKKKTDLKPLQIGLFCITCPILIDASVLITAPNFVPHRFPFASLFPILGCVLGYLSFQHKRGFVTLSILLIPFFYFIDQYLIPKMLFYEYVRDSDKATDNLWRLPFYTTEGSAIQLQDTIHSPYAIVECFFKGCAPCEEKRVALNQLSDSISHEKLSIVYICDGRLTSQKNFRDYANQHQYKKAIYLYDRDGHLHSKLKLNGYPFELLLKDGRILSTFSGFTEMIQEDYLKKQLKLIQ